MFLKAFCAQANTLIRTHTEPQTHTPALQFDIKLLLIRPHKPQI